MQVRLLAQISGTRDGVEWPAPGETATLPDDEAVVLLNAGLAEPVEAAKPESAAAATKPSRRAAK